MRIWERDLLQTEEISILTCPALIGACGCALSLLWFVLFYDDPKDHPCISISEKEYILSSLNQQVEHRCCTVVSPRFCAKWNCSRSSSCANSWWFFPRSAQGHSLCQSKLWLSLFQSGPLLSVLLLFTGQITSCFCTLRRLSTPSFMWI